MVLKILKWQVLRTLKSVLKYWQAAQNTERKSESESEIAMCDRMQMYNIKVIKLRIPWNVGIFFDRWATAGVSRSIMLHVVGSYWNGVGLRHIPDPRNVCRSVHKPNNVLRVCLPRCAMLGMREGEGVRRTVRVRPKIQPRILPGDLEVYIDTDIQSKAVNTWNPQ
jgi:hypothetical protein